MNTPELNRIYLGDNREILKSWPDNFVTSVVCDPPYELNFMGKAWDNTGIANSVPFWREVLRVLKPGGHLLAFSATRTIHRMNCAIEDAGFEIRDQLVWLYATGFPKSLNVSMQLDKMNSVETRRERALRFTGWMRASGITSGQVNKLTASNMGGHYLTDKEQPEVATADMFDKLRPHLPEVPEDIEELVRWRTVESENFKKRKVTGTRTAVDPKTARLGVPGRKEDGTPMTGKKEINLTKAHTELAKKWEGWGTALKPANEPIVLARKPLQGTVADNVMRWGTGALNVEACRVGEDIIESSGEVSNNWREAEGRDDRQDPNPSTHVGRWPANLIVMHSPDCIEVRPGVHACVSICPMRLMELQVQGSTKFFYVPKPDGGERNFGLDGEPLAKRQESREAGKPGGENPRNRGALAVANFHPTVKPIDLMAYLIKLVTPAGGIVLDPFMGSGTTAIAAAKLGNPWLGCEMDAEYLELARKRIAAETSQGSLL